MMPDLQTCLIIYAVGAVIGGIIIGFLDVACDTEGAWAVSAFWPIVLAAALVCGAVAGPVWIGQQLRRLLP